MEVLSSNLKIEWAITVKCLESDLAENGSNLQNRMRF